jgi:hypothetical protein
LTGTAYTCWHISRVPGLQEYVLKEISINLCQKAHQYATSALQNNQRHPAGPPYSLLFGEAGCRAIAAVCAAEAARRISTPAESTRLLEEARAHVEVFRSLAPCAVSADEDEFLYGKAGYLFGCLFLNKHIGENTISDEILTSVAMAMLRSGRRQAHHIDTERRWGAPLWWEWHGSAYLGAAHGAMGE